MNTPNISVIIPVYNAEKYLSCCVDSILSQTFSDFEVIIVDDGSMDQSARICDFYAQKDNRVHVIHKKNEGVSIARNTGIEAASGKYITFVDSDDFIDKDFFDYVINSVSMNEYDMFICGLVMETYNVKNELVDLITYGITDNFRFTIKELFENITLKYPQICLCGPWCKFYKREIIEKYKVRFSPELDYGEDTLFNLSYLKYAERIFFSEKVFYHYRRVNQDSLFSRFHKDTYEVHRLVYGKMHDLILKNKCDKDSLIRFYNMYFSLLISSIRKYFRFFDKTTKTEKISLLRKISNDDMLQNLKFSLVKSIKNALLFICIKLKMYKFIYLLFYIKYRF